MKILIVEDEKEIRSLIKQILGDHTYLECKRMKELETLEWAAVDLLVLDREIIGGDVWAWAGEKKQTGESFPPLVLISGVSDPERSTQAETKFGAPVVCKSPFDDFGQRLRQTVDSLLTPAPVETDIRNRLMQYYDQVYAGQEPPKIVGICAGMKEVIAKVKRYGQKNISVLITGATGTGKELVAERLHKISGRKGERPVVVVPAEFPENLLESELFGIEERVATGVDKRIGRLEQADGGTLFLDEIAEMPMSVQVKLLSFLERQRIRRVGGAEEIQLNVRVIAATHKNLRQEVQKGKFREDLYFRLGGAEIAIPALRERTEKDVDLLLEHLIWDWEKTKEKKPRGTYRITQSLRDRISAYPWPGNVREFKYAVQTALVNAEEGNEPIWVKPQHLPDHVLSPVSSAPLANTATEVLETLVRIEPIHISYQRIEELQELTEVLVLQRLFEHCDRNWSKMAKSCEMPETHRKPGKMNPRSQRIYQRVTGKKIEEISESEETHD